MKLSFSSIGPLEGNSFTNNRIIILHGFMGSSRNWRSLQNAYSQRLRNYQIICLDLRYQICV